MGFPDRFAQITTCVFRLADIESRIRFEYRPPSVFVLE